MALQRLGIAVLLGLTLLAATAAAQEEKNEVVGIVGRTFIDGHRVPNTNFFDNTINFGEGLTVEGSYGRRILGGGLWALTFEVPVLFTPDEQLNYGINAIPESYKAFFVAPSVRANLFAANAVSPWVSVGGGFAHFSESSTLVFGGPNPGQTGTATGVFQIGVGADIRIWRKFSVRGELRDFRSGLPQFNVDTGKSHQSNIFIGGGVVWHF